jgi:hypothetical protein
MRENEHTIAQDPVKLGEFPERVLVRSEPGVVRPTATGSGLSPDEAIAVASWLITAANSAAGLRSEAAPA